MINRNMGCIEMRSYFGNMTIARRLIETWDVLKFDKDYEDDYIYPRLIETWDVLKYPAIRHPRTKQID